MLFRSRAAGLNEYMLRLSTMFEVVVITVVVIGVIAEDLRAAEPDDSAPAVRVLYQVIMVSINVRGLGGAGTAAAALLELGAPPWRTIDTQLKSLVASKRDQGERFSV